MSRYPKTVEAALAESRSKKALAEALAIEIPPTTGRGVTDVTDALRAARDEIVEAGGEPREPETLRKYRATARWVAGVTGEESSAGTGMTFAWVPEASYTSHYEAMAAGIGLADFTANPRTARQTRKENGKASKDGDPSGIVKGWSTEQRIEAAKELHHDPDVAEALYRDPTASAEHSAAITSASNSGQKDRVVTPERVRQDAFWYLEGPLLAIMRDIHSLRMARNRARSDLERHGLSAADLLDNQRESLRTYAAEIRAVAADLEVLAEAESIDKALERILDGE